LDDSPKAGPAARNEGALLHFFMPGLLPARIAELLRFQAFGVLPLVFRRRVIAVLTIRALQRNDFSHR
jgi:hypothetical protein